MFQYFKNNDKKISEIIDLNGHILPLVIKSKNLRILKLFLNGKSDIDKSTKDRLIHEAIKINYQPILNELISQEFVRDSECKCIFPPLFELVSHKRLNLIKKFHEAGANFKDKLKKYLSGIYLLHYALKHRADKKMIKHLLMFGAELSVKNDNNLTPLHYLLTENVVLSPEAKAPLVKLLLKYNSNPNSLGIDNETPLHTAVRNKNYLAVQLLLSYGADINLKNSKNETAFDLATEYHTQQDLNDAGNYICFSFVREINLRKIAKMYIAPEILARIDIIDAYDFSNCTKDLQEVEEIDLIDVLKGDEDNLMKYVRNKKFCDELLDLGVHSFGIWRRILKFQLKKGKQRHILLNKCEVPFVDLLQLPFLVIQKILYFLNRNDLRSLLVAINPQYFVEKLTNEEMKFIASDSCSLSDELSEDGSIYF